jgi:outer membrane protein assembly factor BamB
MTKWRRFFLARETFLHTGAPARQVSFSSASIFRRIAFMTVEDLIFVGLNGYAVALHRETGEIVWSNDQMKSGYVTLLLDFDRLIVSTNGYIYCLDPLTGNIQWHNPMKGYGVGAPTSLVSVRGQTSQTVIEQAAAAAAAAAASHGATT